MSRLTPSSQGSVDAANRLCVDSNEDMPILTMTDLLKYLQGVCDGAAAEWNKLNPDSPAIQRITFSVIRGKHFERI